MSLIIFKDQFGDPIAISPEDIVLLERNDDDEIELTDVYFRMGYRGEVEKRTIIHTVEEAVAAINKVRSSF